MDISKLQVRQGKVEVEGEIIDKQESRNFEKFGNKGKVCNCILKDDSGEISLTLWNDDVNNIKIGDKVKITNGYVNEFQGEKQLTSGRFGKIEII